MKIHLSQISSYWTWHLTSSWAQFLSNKLEFSVSCNKTSCSTFWYVLGVLIFRSSCSQMFFKIGVLKSFTTLTGKRLFWPLRVFFYRTPAVPASEFLWQQIPFFPSWIWYLLLTVAPAFALNSFENMSYKPQKQSLELFLKKVF